MPTFCIDLQKQKALSISKHHSKTESAERSSTTCSRAEVEVNLIILQQLGLWNGS